MHKKMKLYHHQKDIINDARDKVGCFHECGTGKSLTGIKWAEKRANSCLVITPKSVVDKFKNEIKKWSKNNIEWLVISKETFRRDWNKIKKYDAIIYDEFHNFANFKSKLHKSAFNYQRKYTVKYVLGLTGTPFMSSFFNCYSLAKLLGYNWNWWKFKNYFFYDVRMGTRIVPVPREDKKNEIITLFNKIGNTVKLSEIVDMPEIIYEKEYFNMTAEQKKVIKNLDDLLPIVRFSKEFQIANGTLKSDGYIKNQYFKCEKLNRLIDIISVNKKMAIICRHTLEIELIKNSIKKRKVFILQGGTENRQEVVNEINNTNDCIVILQSGICEGFDLYVPLMIFYSIDWSLKNYIQMKARPVRIDHLKTTIYIHLIVKNSIDEEVYKNVVIKKCDFQVKLYEKT